jgi:hypothetical protein
MALSQATFTLLGAVIGVILSGVVADRVERARENRAASAAARLVHAELVGVASQLKVAIDLASPLPFVEEFASEAWQEMRPVLAKADATTWEATSVAYAHVRLLRLSYAGVDFEARGSIEDQGIAEIRDVMASVQRALTVLAKRGHLRDDRHQELMTRTTVVRVHNLPED